MFSLGLIDCEIFAKTDFGGIWEARGGGGVFSKLLFLTPRQDFFTKVPPLPPKCKVRCSYRLDYYEFQDLQIQDTRAIGLNLFVSFLGCWINLKRSHSSGIDSRPSIRSWCSQGFPNKIKYRWMIATIKIIYDWPMYEDRELWGSHIVGSFLYSSSGPYGLVFC